MKRFLGWPSCYSNGRVSLHNICPVYRFTGQEQRKRAAVDENPPALDQVARKRHNIWEAVRCQAMTPTGTPAAITPRKSDLWLIRVEHNIEIHWLKQPQENPGHWLMAQSRPWLHEQVSQGTRIQRVNQ